jgi:putative nucleotidyltransferase with HDIG domain
MFVSRFEFGDQGGVELSLRTKIFLLTAGILVCSVVLGALLIQRQVRDVMLVEAEKSLATTRDALEQLARARAANREAQAGIVSRLDALAQGVAAGDSAGVQRVAETLFPRLQQIDLFAVVDSRGRLLAAVGPVVDDHPAGRFPAPTVEPIHAVLTPGETAAPPPAQGIWILGDELLEIVAAPVVSGDGSVVGALLLGARVGHTVADRLQRISQSQVVILAADRIVGSSLPPALAEAVVAHFPDLMPGITAPERTPAERTGRGGPPAPREMEVRATPYLAEVTSLPVDFGGGRCNHIILRSLADTQALRQKVWESLVLTGLLGLAAAFAVAWLGARHIAQPLRRLAETMSRIARSGELERPEPVRGSREVLLFQEAFRHMLDSLEASQRDRERSYVEAIGAVLTAIDRRDQESAGHSYRVACYAVALARKMGVGDRELRAVEWGALLHDVGKIAVPDEILRKRGPLTEKEWQIMRQHPSWGYEMLADVHFLRPALDIVYNHHERWDGTGYPRGLRKDRIPLPARIFAVVDTYDAITSDRHYRRARGHQDAVNELQRVSGFQLDPEAVEAFLDIPHVELRRLRALTYSLSDIPRMPPSLRDLLAVPREMVG